MEDFRRDRGGHGECVGGIWTGIGREGIFVSNTHLECKLVVHERVVVLARVTDGLNLTVFDTDRSLTETNK